MMEFWHENQAQLPPYAKFGTVPGRNCTHNYHDRHQAPHYPPVYYGEQQDQGRESSYWTLPGSRTGGALQEYTNWTEPELPALTSSHFPFILDRHSQQHQDLGEYQAQEARDREWTAAQRATREYERGCLREGWQRRWEPCSPVRYNREVSKRTDSSYRELEAWAARYSHSLPRRRRIEAELRGASQGLLESSRDSRSGTDPRATTLQQVRQSANIRESGLWDRGVRQQAPTYYPPQVPAPDTSHMLDIKEKTGYQRRMFSQPPGYIAPPPYNSPHKSSPVTHHCDTNWEQEGKRQTYWTQPTLRKQDMYDNNRDKEDSQKLEGNQKPCPELEGLKHHEAGIPVSIQNTQIQHERLLSLQQPQTIQAVQNTKTNEETSSKVIEGRKFRLNRKTGGLTIFCLVSRIAGTTETPSLPLCASQTIIQSTELGEVTKGLRNSSDVNQILADEVDFRAQTLTEQSNTQPSAERNLKDKQMGTPTCIESETLVENLSNKEETDGVSPGKNYKIDADSTFARQVAQSVPPMSVKYPLWREPSFTSKVNSEEGASDGVHNPEDCAEVSHPIDVDIKKDNESEDSNGLLVIDTTCVVVKMELLPSPEKAHVDFLDSTDQTELSPLDSQSTITPECAQSTSQPNQDEATDQNAEESETELESDLVAKKTLQVESEIHFPCLPSSPVFERETLEERAERILGISLEDCVFEQQPEDATSSLLELCVEDQDEEVESSQMKNNDVNDEYDTKEEEQSQKLLELDQTEGAVCLTENDDAKDLVANEGGEDFTGPQEQASSVSKVTYIDCQPGTDLNNEVETINDPLLESRSEEGQEENQLIENNTSSQDPSQCLIPPTDLDNSSSPSPSLDCEEPNTALALTLSLSDLTSLSCISESTTVEGPDPELTAIDSAANLEILSLPQTPSQQLPSPLPAGSIEPSPCSTDHSPVSPPLDLMVPTAEAMSNTNSCVVDQVEEGQTSQLIENEISDAPEVFSKDMSEEQVSQQQFEFDQSEETACVKDSDMTEEQLPKEVNQHPTDLLEETLEICEENVTDSQTEIEVNILQQQFDYGRGEDAFGVKETEEPSQKDEEDPVGLLQQIISKEDATDCQAQIEILQDCEMSETSLDVLSQSQLPPPPLLLLDSCGESLQFSSSCSSESAPVLPPSSSAPPPLEEESGSFSPGLSQKDEPQYPKSLWDAVNRIRKHTAPDSENEEEEVSELWDPECVGDDLGCSDVVVVDFNSEDVMSYFSEAKQEATVSSPHTNTTGEKEVFDEAGQQEVSEEGSVEDVEAGRIKQDPCHEESNGHAEEDTLSCSSISSHNSGDTVIVADEDEAEETPKVVTERKTETYGEFHTAEGEQSCSDEVKDETVGEEVGDG